MVEISGKFQVKISYPSIPLGDELIENTVVLKNNAITSVYKSLDTSSLERLSKADRLVFLPKEEVLSREENDRRFDDILLYQLLKHSGVPASVLRSHWCFSSEGFPVSWNPLHKRPKIYMDERFKKSLSSDNEATRARHMITFGLSIAVIDFYNLAFSNKRDNLSTSPWREEFISDLDRNFYPEIAAESDGDIDIDKLKEAKDVERSVLEKDGGLAGSPIFRGVGAMVLCVVLPNSELSPEHKIGLNFMPSTIDYLMELVRRNFISSLQQKRIINPRASYQHVLDVAFGEDLRKEMQRSIEEAKNLLGLMGLKDEQTVLPEFIAGRLPDIYYQRLIAPIIKPELGNPFDYGQTPVTGEYALERYLTRVITGKEE